MALQGRHFGRRRRCELLLALIENENSLMEVSSGVENGSLENQVPSSTEWQNIMRKSRWLFNHGVEVAGLL